MERNKTRELDCIVYIHIERELHVNIYIAKQMNIYIYIYIYVYMTLHGVACALRFHSALRT